MASFHSTEESLNFNCVAEVSKKLDTIVLDYVRQLGELQKQREVAILDLKHKILDSAIPEIMMNIERLSSAEDEKFKTIYGQTLENAIFQQLMPR